jgi:hypothetical protein
LGKTGIFPHSWIPLIGKKSLKINKLDRRPVEKIGRLYRAAVQAAP